MLTGNFNPTAALVITGNDNVCTSNFTPQNEMTMEDRSKSLSNEGKFHTLANAPSKPTQIHCHPHTKDNVALLNTPVNDNASNSNLRVSSLIAHFHEKTGEETSTNSRKSKPPWKCNSRGSLKAAHSENNSHSDATLHDWSNNHNIGYKASNFRPKLNLQQGGNIHSALLEDCRSHLYTNGRLKSGASDSLSRDTQDKNNNLSQGKNRTKKTSQLCEDNIKREKSSTNTQNLLISDDVPSYSSYHGLLSATERAALRPELHSAPCTPQETKEAKPKVLAHNLICPVSEVADNSVKLKDPTLNSVSHESNYVSDVPWTQFQSSKTPLHTQLPFASNAEHNQASFNRQNKNTQIQGEYRKSGRDAIRPVDADADADALAPLDSGTHGPFYYNKSSHSANLGNASPIITPQIPGKVCPTARSEREQYRQSGANPKVPPKTKPKPKLIKTKGASPQQTVNSTGTANKYPNSPAPSQGYHNAAGRAASGSDLHSAPRTPHKSGETKPNIFGHNLRSPVSEVPDKGVSFKNPTVNNASHEPHYVSDVSSTQFHSSKTTLHSQSPLASNAEHNQASANDGFFIQPKAVHGVILGESERSTRNTPPPNTESRSINGNTSNFSKHQPFSSTVDGRPSETDGFKDCHPSLSSQSAKVSRLSQSCSNLDKIEKKPSDDLYGSATSIRDLVARYEKNKTDENAPLTMDAAAKQAMTGRENPNTRKAEPQSGYSGTQDKQLTQTQKSEPVFRPDTFDTLSCSSRTITSIEEEDDYSTNSPTPPKTHKSTYSPSRSSNKLGSVKRQDLSYLPSFKPKTSFYEDVVNDSREVVENVPEMSVNKTNINTQIQGEYRMSGRVETRPVDVDADTDTLAPLDSSTHCLSYNNGSSQSVILGNAFPIVTPQMPENVYPKARSEREHYRQSGAKSKVPPKTKPKPKLIQTKGASPQQTVNSTGTSDEYQNSPANFHTFTKSSTINVTLDHDSVNQTKPFSSTHENAVRSRDTDDGLKKKLPLPDLSPHRKSQSENRSHISTYGSSSADSARTENKMIQQYRDPPQVNQHVLKAPSGIQFPKGAHRPTWSRNDLGPSTPIGRFQHLDSNTLSTLDRTSTEQNKQPSFRSDVRSTPGSEREPFVQSDEQLKSSTSKSGLDDQNRGRFYQKSQSEGRSQTSAAIQGEYRKSGRHDKQSTDDDALAPPDSGKHCLPYPHESKQSANLDCASPIVTPQMPETPSPRDALYNAGNYKVCTSNFPTQNEMTQADRSDSRNDQRPQHTLDNLPSIKGYGNSSIEGNPPLSHGIILGESERSVQNIRQSNTEMRSINGNTSDFSKHQPFDSTIDHRPSETNRLKDCHLSLSSQSTKVSRLSQSCSNLDKIEKESDDNMYGSATSIRDLVARYDKNTTDKNAPLTMDAATKQAMTGRENPNTRTAEPQTGYSDTRNEQLTHTQKSEPVFRSDKSSCPSRTITSIKEEDDYSTNNPISPKTHKDTYPPSLSSNELGSVKRPDLSHLPRFKPETSFTKDVANDSREAVGNVPAMSVNIQNTNTQIQGGYRKSGRGETRPVNVDDLATLDSGTHCLSHYNESSQYANLGHSSTIVTPQMPENVVYPTAMSEREQYRQSSAKPKVPPKTMPKPKLIQTKGASPQQTVNSTGTADEYRNSPAHSHTFTKSSTINVTLDHDSVSQTKPFSSTHENAVRSRDTDDGLKKIPRSPELTPHRKSQSEDRSHISTYGPPSAHSARTENQMIQQHSDQPQFNQHVLKAPSGIQFPKGDYRPSWSSNDLGPSTPIGRFQHQDSIALSTLDRTSTEQNKQPSFRSDVVPTPGSERKLFAQSDEQLKSSTSKSGLDDQNRGRFYQKSQSEGRSQTTAPIQGEYRKSGRYDKQNTDDDALAPPDYGTHCLPHRNESNQSANLDCASPIVTPQMPETLSPRDVLYRSNAGNHKVCTSNFTSRNEMTMVDRCRSRSDQRPQHTLDNLPSIKGYGNSSIEGNPPLLQKHADVHPNVKVTCKIEKQTAFDVLSDSSHQGYHNAAERAASRSDLHSAPRTPHKSGETKPNIFGHNLRSPVSEVPDKGVSFKNPTVNNASHESHYVSDVPSTHFHSSKTTLHSQSPLAGNAEHNQASANDEFFVQPKPVHGVILGESERSVRNTLPSNTKMKSINGNTSDFSKHQPFSSTVDDRPSETDGFKDCHPSLSSQSTKVSRLSQPCSNLDKIEKEPDDNMYGSATSIRDLVARYDKNTTDKNAPLTMDAATKQAMTGRENPNTRTAEPQTGYSDTRNEQLSHTQKSEPVFRSDKSSCPSRTITSIEEEDDYSTNSSTPPKSHKNTYPPSLSSNKLGSEMRPDLSYLPRFKPETSFSQDVAKDSREVVENVPAISVNRRNKNTQIEEEYRKRGRGETRPVDADTKADALATLDSGTHCPSYYIESNQSANQGNASPIVSPQMPGNIYPTAKSEIEHNRESDAKPKVPPKTMPKPKLIQAKGASPQQTVNSTGRSTADEYPNSPAHSHTFIKPSAINVHPDSVGQTKQFSSPHENAIDLRSRETDNDLKMKLASPESTPHRRSQSEDRSHISTYGTPSAGSARTQNQIIRQHRDQPQFNHNKMDGPSGMPFPKDDHRRLTVHSQLPLVSNAEHNQASASDGSFVHGVILGESDRANQNTLPSNTEMRSVKVNTRDFSKHQPFSSTIEHRSSGTDGFKDCHPSLSSHSAKVSRLSQSCSNLDNIEKEPDENMYGSATSITKLVTRYEKNKIDENAPLTLDAAAKLTMTVGKENPYIKRAGYSGTQEKQLCPSQTTDPVFRSGKESCFSRTITSIEEEGGYSSNSPSSPKRYMNTYPPSLSSNKLGPVKTPDLSFLPSFKPETSFSKDVANDSREVVGNVPAGIVNRQNINTQIQGGYRKSGQGETRPVNADANAPSDFGTHCPSYYNESSQYANLGNASPCVTPQMPGNIYPTAKSEIEHNIQSRANPKVPPKTMPKPKLIQTKGASPQQTVNSTGTTDEYPNSSAHFYTFTKPSTINVHPDSVGQTKQFSSPHENAIDQRSHETDEGLKMKLASPESTPHRISQSEDRSHISTYGAPSAGSARTQNQMIPQHRDQPQFNHNMMDDPSGMTFPEGDHCRLWPRNDSGSGSPTGRFQHLDANTLSTADIGTKQNKQPSYQSNVQFNDQHQSSISRSGVDDQHRGRSHLRSQSEGRSQTSAPTRDEYRKSGLHDTQSTYADALAPLDSGTHCLPYLNESNQTNLRNGNPTVAPEMPGNFSPTVRSRFEREQYRQKGWQPEVLMKPKLLPPKGASSEQSVNVTGMAGEYPNPPAHSHTFTKSSKKNVKFHPDSVGQTKNSPSTYAVSDEKPRRARETDYGFEKGLASPKSIQHRRSKSEDRSTHGPPRASSRKPSVSPPNKNVNVQNKSSHRKPAGCDSSSESDSEDGCSPPVCFEDFVQLCSKLKKSGLTRSCPNINIYMQPVTQDKRRKKKITVNRPRAVGIGNKSMKLYDGNDNESESEETDSNDDDEDDGKTVTL